MAISKLTGGTKDEKKAILEKLGNIIYKTFGGIFLVKDDVKLINIYNAAKSDLYAFRDSYPAICMEIIDNNEIHINTGLSLPRNGYNSIFDCCVNAEKALEYKFYAGPGQAILLDNDNKCNNDLTIDYHHLTKELEEFNFDCFAQDIKNYFEGIVESVFYTDPYELIKICEGIIYFLIYKIGEMGIDDKELNMRKLKYFKDIESSAYFETLKNNLFSIISDIILYAKNEWNALSKPILSDVLEYLAKNYNNDITLEMLAKKFNVNYSYLSQIFTRHMGESFSKYLARLRVEKAKTSCRSEK